MSTATITALTLDTGAMYDMDGDIEASTARIAAIGREVAAQLRARHGTFPITPAEDEARRDEAHIRCRELRAFGKLYSAIRGQYAWTRAKREGWL